MEAFCDDECICGGHGNFPVLFNHDSPGTQKKAIL